MRRLYGLLAALAAVFVLGGQLLAAETAKPYRLTILHTNDIHARMAEFNHLGQTCTQDESAQGACFGGYPRITAAVEAERKKGGNTLLLDAGDQFQGTLFYTALKGKPSQTAMNALRYQAMTLGNHEFDDGPANLEQTFLSGLNAPVLAANLDASGDPALKARIKPWTVLTVGGRKVGIVGLANEDTSRLSNPGPELAFHDAAQALRRSVQELAAQKADIVVAVTHVGLERDRQLAAEVDGVDVIVGGHSHSLLSNTDPKAAAPYPLVVKSPSGRPVLIVQAEAWGKYLGELSVDFDAKGTPVSWSGAPLLLDASKPQDGAMLARVRAMQEELKPYVGQVAGKVTENLLPDCRFGECGLGDILADAIRMSARNQGVQAAFVNAGAIRAGLKAGDVTVGDLLTFYPFTDNVATFQLSGRDLLTVLEHGVSLADKPDGSGTGRFLQVSGLRYSFDARRPQGQRIVTADILDTDGGYAPVQPDKTYSLATSGYLLKGGDGYSMLKEKAKRVYAFGAAISDALADHFAGHSPLSPRLEGRIVRLGDALPK
ncbi:bifunctional metallophosphatase/5'-nucleotidase [Fundidesulfovibrio agrisoli]|uniref:bifunctional metallophosphatase/5'-nucleotidase n=1 Tax=Fundidesulfovibrio agrisoli TaxID=2922717 RepID=UPI001FAB87A2|nr:bifunctional metallophosphatase/5'-nucleotidase [Fundidesulfovibrio agrisoli]